MKDVTESIRDLMDSRAEFAIVVDAVDGIRVDLIARGWSEEMAAQIALVWFSQLMGLAPGQGGFGVNDSTTCSVCSSTSETRTCIPCRNRLRNMLAELPEQYVYVTMSRQRDKGSTDGRSSARLHAPLPGREDVLNALGPGARQHVSNSADADDQVGEMPLLHILASCVQVLNEERGLRPVKVHVSTLTDRLTRHPPYIVEQPWAPDLYLELTELLHHVRSITRTEPRRVTLPVMCPSCDALTLIREDWSGWAAECLLCSVKMDTADYQALVRDTADLADAG